MQTVGCVLTCGKSPALPHRASTRGAMNSLMAEVIEQHVEDNLLNASNDRNRAAAAEELLDVISAYLK
jgi:DNA-binding FrmR family transcriptional regulator